MIDLADRRLGAGVVAASDEFFGDAATLLDPRPPAFDPDAYTPRGKLLDGWETRRRRGTGHDWAVVRLGAPGVLAQVEVDTTHFTGNAPQACGLWACAVDGYPDPDELAAAAWHEVLPAAPVAADAVNRFAVQDQRWWTHVRLDVHPDGGVARLRVRGAALPDPRLLDGAPRDLAACEDGAEVVDCSDAFYGRAERLLLPGPATGMGDGWETRRRRGSGHDWVQVRLAALGVPSAVVVDTTHFRGNAPRECRLTGADATTGDPQDPDAWSELLPRTRLQPDTPHRFPLGPAPPVTHVRLEIHPDGGLARFRLPGALEPLGRERIALRWLDALPAEHAETVLAAANAAPAWTRAVVAGRPYADRAALLAAADKAAATLDDAGWRAAFAAHPRLGARGRLTAASRREQAGALVAGRAAAEALEAGNRAYEERFGHVFLVCAAGLDAAELLRRLHERLENDPATELAVAAAEHRRITALRLEGLLGG